MGIFAVILLAAALGVMALAFRRLMVLGVARRGDWFTEVARRLQWLMSAGLLLAVLGLLAALGSAQAPDLFFVAVGAYGFGLVVMLAYPFSDRP